MAAQYSKGTILCGPCFILRQIFDTMQKIFLLLALTMATVCAKASSDTLPRPKAKIDSAFYLAIEDAYFVHGTGVVATGFVSTGTVQVGKQIELKNYGATAKAVRVTDLHKGGKRMSGKAVPGDYIGIVLDKNIAVSDLKRGMVLTDTGFAPLRNQLTANMKLNANAGISYKNGDLLSIYIHGQVVPNCKMVLPTGQQLKPGQQKTVTLQLPSPLALMPGLDVVIWGPRNTAVGQGKVLMP
jgi:translation elongation factor EF-Tu-like GTPase